MIKPKTAVKKVVKVEKIEAEVSPETEKLLSEAETVLKPKTKKYAVDKTSKVPKSIQKNLMKIKKQMDKHP